MAKSTNKLYRLLATIIVLCGGLMITFPAACKTCAGSKPKAHGITKAKAYLVSGTVQQRRPYCGGARPSAEMERAVAAPRPYPGKRFYLRSGIVNSLSIPVVASFVTDSNGFFSIALPAGTYAVIVEEQLRATSSQDYAALYQKGDEKCLQEWWQKPYYQLIVKDADVEHLNFVFARKCFVNTDVPCINYSGPMPP